MKIKSVRSIIAVALGIITIIFTVSIINSKDMKTVQTSGVAVNESSDLSNKKIGWGIKRNDNHEQPDLGAENKKLIEKFNRTCNGKQRKQEYISNI